MREHDMYATRDAIADALRASGTDVTGIGDGYSNGVFADLSIKLANGRELYILIEEVEE